jgi:hypothetical protein
MRLSEMYEQLRLFSTDKGTAHDYLCGYYNNEFKDLRELPLNILEIDIDISKDWKLFDLIENKGRRDDILLEITKNK